MKRLIQYPIILCAVSYAVLMVFAMGALVVVKQLFPVHQGEK